MAKGGRNRGSDDLGSISFPIGIVDLRHQTLEDVATLARQQGVDGIVAGLPTTLSGEEGFQAREARAMAEELAGMVDVRIVFWDERLTSTIADRVIGAGGRKKKNRASGERDAVAASIMLQDYLDANPLRAKSLDGERESLSSVTSWTIDVIESLGYIGVALMVAVENLFTPIPSEVIFQWPGFLSARAASRFCR